MNNAWPLDDWITSLRASGRAPATCRLRRYHVARFARDHPDLWAVTMRDVEAYLAELVEPEYQKSVKASLNSYFKWAIRNDIAVKDPTRDLLPVRVIDKGARPCPEHVIRQALAGADDDVRLMILLMYRAGLRRAEVAGIHSDDIDGISLTVQGKGSKFRRVPLDPVLQAELATCPGGFLFPGLYGVGHMRPNTVGRKVSRALGPGWSAHSLRHRAATHAYGRTHNILMVQKVLGHKSAATTQRYVKLDDSEMQSWRDAMMSA